MSEIAEAKLLGNVKLKIKTVLQRTLDVFKLTNISNCILSRQLEKGLISLKQDLMQEIDEKLKHHFGFRMPTVFSKDGQILIHTVDHQRLFRGSHKFAFL